MSRSHTFFISVVLVFFVSANIHANEVEKKFIDAGLVNIHSIDKSIKVDLVNSDPDKIFYNGLNNAYLREEVAQKLSVAQKHLKSELPDYSILIMDAARPRSVSQLMYDKMKRTKFEKFVANPDRGSMHSHIPPALPEVYDYCNYFTLVFIGYLRNR